MLFSVQGVPALISSPLAGLLIQNGSYALAFLVAGLALIAGGTLFVALPCVRGSGLKHARSLFILLQTAAATGGAGAGQCG